MITTASFFCAWQTCNSWVQSFVLDIPPGRNRPKYQHKLHEFLLKSHLVDLPYQNLPHHTEKEKKQRALSQSSIHFLVSVIQIPSNKSSSQKSPPSSQNPTFQGRYPAASRAPVSSRLDDSVGKGSVGRSIQHSSSCRSSVNLAAEK